MSGGTRIIGVDFDNTLVTYDEIFYNVAIQRGLLSPTAGRSKKNVRDLVRQMPNGEIEWQKVQSLVYGPLLKDAQFTEGVESFFKLCKRNGVKIFIVSHKTEFSKYDETHTNLRTAALSWMASNRVFEAEGLGLAPESVFFCATRHEKIRHITQIGCTHFIDDLEETFLEPDFPADVEKILFVPNGSSATLVGGRVAGSWQEISEYFFGASD